MKVKDTLSITISNSNFLNFMLKKKLDRDLLSYYTR